jgi:hypothetical protein
MYRPLALLIAFCVYVAGVWAVAGTEWAPPAAAGVVGSGSDAAPVSGTSSSSPGPRPTPSSTAVGIPATWTLSTLRNYLVAETDAKDPGVALADLERITRKSPYVDGFCHPVAHEIGHAALAEYKGDFTKAVSYRNDVCGSGYLHGVVEEKLSQSPNPRTAVTTLCAPAQTGSCIHGIGHGAMFVSGLNVADAERLCDRFPQPDEVGACSEGVFMQLFEPDESDPKAMAELPADKLVAEPLYPCPEQPGIFQSGCYYYAPSYFLQVHDYAHHPGAFVQALTWCLKAPNGDGRSTCTMGTGSRLMKYNIDRPVWTAAQCEQASTEGLRKSCFAGMVSYWNVNFHDKSAGSKLCPQLGGEARRLCAAVSGSGGSAD